MTTAANISNYIEHNCGLGKHFRWEALVLLAFARSVGDTPLHKIEPAMIAQFIDRKGTRDITKRKKYRVLERFFRFSVARGRLKVSPVPATEWKRTKNWRCVATPGSARVRLLTNMHTSMPIDMLERGSYVLRLHSIFERC